MTTVPRKTSELKIPLMGSGPHLSTTMRTMHPPTQVIINSNLVRLCHIDRNSTRSTSSAPTGLTSDRRMIVKNKCHDRHRSVGLILDANLSTMSYAYVDGVIRMNSIRQTNCKDSIDVSVVLVNPAFCFAI